MLCKNCRNKNGFLVVVTDYKPLEMWEFNQGALTRYCQKDTGDLEVNIECAVCGSSEVDYEGFNVMMYAENPLIVLSDDEWEKKISNYRKEIPEEEIESEIEEEIEQEQLSTEEINSKEDKKNQEEQK